MSDDMTTFAKLSTDLWQNEKARTLAMEHPTAFAAWTFAISYCAKELNDGELSRFKLRTILGATDEDIDVLVQARMLDEHDDGSLWLHDFVATQGRSRADVEESRAKKAQAGRKGGVASGKARATKQQASENEAPAKHNEAERSTAKQQASKTNPDTDTDTEDSSNEESLPLPPHGGRETGTGTDRDYTLEFEQFWQAYPRHEGKRRAFDQFRKARRKTRLAILIAKATAYGADPNREPGYTLTAANWLAGEHWDDDPLPAKPAKTGTSARARPSSSAQNLEANASLIARFKAEETQQAAPKAAITGRT